MIAMTKWNIETGKKVTGGKINLHRKKKRFQKVSLPVLTKIDKEKKRIERNRSGIKKIRLAGAEFANLIDSNTKKMTKVKILSVLKNDADPQSVRRGVITKGAIIKTEGGEAKVTSKPSQHGVVNALLIEKENIKK